VPLQILITRRKEGRKEERRSFKASPRFCMLGLKLSSKGDIIIPHVFLFGKRSSWKVGGARGGFWCQDGVNSKRHIVRCIWVLILIFVLIFKS